MAKKKHERDASKSKLFCAIVQHLSAAGFSAEEIAGLVAYNPPLTAEQIAAIVPGSDYRYFVDEDSALALAGRHYLVAFNPN